MSAYPSREPFYAHRLTRLLFKSCAAQSIGQDAVLLIIHIAHTEDAARYQGPVRFWNSQLNEVLGFRSPKTLNNARTKAVQAGWLIYERKHDRTDGRYWTCIPQSVLAFDDEPIEPTFSPVPVPGTEQVAEQESDGKRNRKGTGDGSLPHPAPVPVPNTSRLFEEWYQSYPRKVAKGDAAKAYKKVLKEIAREYSVQIDQAASLLHDWTQARLPALLATEATYRPHPATWLNGGRYRDELPVNKPDPSHKPFQSGRLRA